MLQIKPRYTTVRLKKLELGVIDDLEFKDITAIKREDINQRDPIQKRFS